MLRISDGLDNGDAVNVEPPPDRILSELVRYTGPF